MKKIASLLFVSVVVFSAAGPAFSAGTSFRAAITNDSLATGELFFTINIYCNNNDTILPPPYEERTTWTSSFSFDGTITIDWTDTVLMNNGPYFDDAVLTKYATSQFNEYWDFFRAVYVESWDDGSLPDRFAYAGIANEFGYPPALGEIKILSWRAKTPGSSGLFCVEIGDMNNNVYDWIFDEPMPTFLKQCWTLDDDTLVPSPMAAPALDSMYDTLTVLENDTLVLPGKVFYRMNATFVGYDTIRASDADGDDIFMSYYSPDIPSAQIEFTDIGNGAAHFKYFPDYNSGGLRSIYFIASDRMFADTEKVHILVMDDNRAPVLDYIPTPKYIGVGETLIFDISASDAENDTIHITATDMPPYSELYNWRYSGGKWWITFKFTARPEQNNISYTVHFRAQDGFYYDTQTVVINVGEPPSSSFFRVALSGPGVIDEGGVQKIILNEDFNIDLYANNNDSVLYGICRLVWSSPFEFSGNAHIEWGDTADIPTSQFLDFWDFLQMQHFESWNGILPDYYCFAGIGMNGYCPGLGEIKVLSWKARAIDSAGFITMSMTDLDEPYRWHFEDPVPIFETVSWQIIDTAALSPDSIGWIVRDTMGAAIPGAIVELWIDFPGGTLFDLQITDSMGIFYCNYPAAQPFDIFAHKTGYYPSILSDLTDDGIPNEITLTPIARPTPTWQMIFFYCGESRFLGAPIPAGSVIDAYDPDGVLCGTWQVTISGRYGFMPVYRDDFTTPDIDEGADPGDSISFFVNGLPANTSATAIWGANGDRIEICLSVPIEEERHIILEEGWNLVSWNVDTPSDSILSILAPVMDCIEVVLGFENGGFAFDPELMDFSTLWNLDHFHGYWIKMNCAYELVVTGLPVAATAPIDLEAGWNLVSYLPRNPDSTEHALGSILDNLAIALGYDNGGLSYDPNLPQYSNLWAMSPGFGYWVKVNTEDQLIYPGVGSMATYSRPLASLNEAVIENNVPVSNQWISLYSSELKLDGKVVSEGSVITAFRFGGDIIGAGTVKEGGKLPFISIYGDDPSTEARDGLKSGEEFYLAVDGIKTAETIIWTENGSRIEIKSLTSKDFAPKLPADFCLYQNYPNPFNPITEIRFDLPVNCQATLDIYNIIGQRVITLVNRPLEAGAHTVQWNGLDANGFPAASGLYLYRLKGGNFIDTKKMLLLK
jgi:hypothetical protein